MKQSQLLEPLAFMDFHKGPESCSLYFVINGLTVSFSFILLYMLVSGKFTLLLTYLLKAT